MYFAKYLCQFGICSSITKTLERYQKSSYGGPDTAVQNKENEVSCNLFFLMCAPCKIRFKARKKVVLLVRDTYDTEAISSYFVPIHISSYNNS
jgi:hypothetical protein